MSTYTTPYHGHEDLSAYSFLVTGGAGFIGSNLVEYLLKYGAGKVRVLDNFSTGFKKNIKEFRDYPNFEFVEGDIRILNACKRAVNGIDYVFHEAALGSVPRSILDPATTNQVNITGFLNILIASRDEKVKRIVYAASSSTYGDSAAMPKEEEKIGKPLSPYALTKYVNELYADVFARTFGMELIGLRYFNVFGQRQNPDGAYAAVIPKFILQLMDHQSPLINGDGTFSRDFTYIDNVVQMNIKAMLAKTLPATPSQIYNVAYGEQTSLNELVEILKESLSEIDAEISKIPVQYGPERIGDIPHSLASIRKAVALLDYLPLYSIKTGLKETVAWYAEEKNAAAALSNELL